MLLQIEINYSLTFTLFLPLRWCVNYKNLKVQVLFILSLNYYIFSKFRCERKHILKRCFYFVHFSQFNMQMRRMYLSSKKIKYETLQIFVKVMVQVKANVLFLFFMVTYQLHFWLVTIRRMCLMFCFTLNCPFTP